MNFEKFFHEKATTEKLKKLIQEAINESVHDFVKKPNEQAIEGAIDHSLEQGIRETLGKISTWKLTPETFHDAFRMCVISSKKIALKMLAEQHEEDQFTSRKPDIPLIDTSHAEVILNGREPSFLKEVYETAMKEYSESPKKSASELQDPAQKEIRHMHSEQKKFVQVKNRPTRMWDLVETD